MSQTRTSHALRLLAISSIALTAGCTSTQPIGNAPIDMQDMARVFECPIGRVATCERRTNQRYECYCADKDIMRDVLDPEKP